MVRAWACGQSPLTDEKPYLPWPGGQKAGQERGKLSTTEKEPINFRR